MPAVVRSLLSTVSASKSACLFADAENQHTDKHCTLAALTVVQGLSQLWPPAAELPNAWQPPAAVGCLDQERLTHCGDGL
jgi:hypothetical protein